MIFRAFFDGFTFFFAQRHGVKKQCDRWGESTDTESCIELTAVCERGDEASDKERSRGNQRGESLSGLDHRVPNGGGDGKQKNEYTA